MHTFGIGFEIIHYRLPSLLLQTLGVLILRLEPFEDAGIPINFGEFNRDLPAISQDEFYALQRLYACILSEEIKTDLAVTGFHAVGKASAFSEVIGSLGTMPVVAGVIPICDVFRLGPEGPGSFYGDVDEGGDFEVVLHGLEVNQVYHEFHQFSRIAPASNFSSSLHALYILMVSE